MWKKQSISGWMITDVMAIMGRHLNEDNNYNEFLHYTHLCRCKAFGFLCCHHKCLLWKSKHTLFFIKFWWDSFACVGLSSILTLSYLSNFIVSTDGGPVTPCVMVDMSRHWLRQRQIKYLFILYISWTPKWRTQVESFIIVKRKLVCSI